jgi:ABC-type multidrug transport system fused ATPase/permease subunit
MERDLREKQKELEAEIRDFEKERESVRNIVGKIGGKPAFKTRLVNVIFMVLVLVVFALSILYGGKVRFFMIEVGILLLSLKLVFFLESQIRLNHFQFWILSSLEWRINKLDKRMRDLKDLAEKKNCREEKEENVCS